MQVHVLKNRFNEYRQNLFYETLEIMSEAKREQLTVLSNGMDGCSDLTTENATRLLDYETRLADLMAENQELSMTISKMRSIHAIKDVAIRTVYERKIKKLANEIKMAEEKLWECYQDSEAREKILKRQLNRTQKVRIT
jgi:hypothetical protein